MLRNHEGAVLTNKEIQKKPWHWDLLIFPVFVLFRIWMSTVRVTFADGAKEKMGKENSPQIVVFWHNHLFTIPKIKKLTKKHQTIRALVSASKDGAWLEAVFKWVGLDCIRGSANFRGAQAIRDMVQCVRNGDDIGITPDGSKGPVYKVKPGAAAVARLCKCKIALMGLTYTSSWRLKSWDKFHIPKPFSKVTVKVELLENYDELGEKDPEKASKIIEKRLLALQPVQK